MQDSARILLSAQYYIMEEVKLLVRGDAGQTCLMKEESADTLPTMIRAGRRFQSYVEVQARA